MLNIILTREITNNTVFFVEYYFESAWEHHWIDNDFARAVIKDIDNCEVVAPCFIRDQYSNLFVPQWLSIEVLTILSIMFHTNNNLIFDIVACTLKSTKWLQRIGAVRDVTIQTSDTIFLEDNEHLPVRLVNTDKLYYSSVDTILAMEKIVSHF